MKLLQVKEYHQIARRKREKALNYWRKEGAGYGYPVESMYYFMLEDSRGYPTVKRKNGWVAFDEHRAIWGKNRKEALKRW